MIQHESNPPHPSLFPHPPQPLLPPQQQSNNRIMMMQEQLPPKPEEPHPQPPHCVADKSLMSLPPMISLQ